MVHAAHLTPEQLADVLAAFRKGSIPVNAMDMITEEETDYIIRSVTEVVEYLRGFSPIWRDLMSGKKEFIL